MTDREKLIKLLNKVQDYGTKNTCEGWSVAVECKDNETIVDHLIANGVTVQEWISVKDRLPDTAERVLVCRTWLGTVFKPVYGYYQDFPNQKGCWYVLTEEGYYPQREVTHWMPLPQPPKGE